jgi:ABC-type long-subunit fatty acid transport system fused permease/ATPase subunit
MGTYDHKWDSLAIIVVVAGTGLVAYLRVVAKLSAQGIELSWLEEIGVFFLGLLFGVVGIGLLGAVLGVAYWVFYRNGRSASRG